MFAGQKAFYASRRTRGRTRGITQFSQAEPGALTGFSCGGALPNWGVWRRLRGGRETREVCSMSCSDSSSPTGNAMSREVYYHQHCPICGRLLQIRVNLLGQRVYCQHCCGGFLALDEQMQIGGQEPVRTAADRADELLRQAALVLEQSEDGGGGLYEVASEPPSKPGAGNPGPKPARSLSRFQ